ncbi:uncharacterized protein LOC135940603 [Cloeon dipterum]|uniref:uncharacterized protein LOC135940603 n=1 Tax=Cloeon dipterum TaxID=197152 RepID=UPI0032202B29
MASKPVNPARLPWLTGYTNEKLEIEDSEFFDLFMERGDFEAGELNVFVYKILNECLPHYLSPKFHCMKSMELSKDNSFVNLQAALHFFLANNAHSAKLYKVLMSRPNDLLLSPNILVYLKTTRKFMTPGFELCTKPRDFILDPWILVQLPFQPSILQQWVAAVYVEYLKLREQMAFFTVVTFPPSLREIIEVLFLLQSLFMKTIKEVFHVLDINCKTSNMEEATSATIEMMKGSGMKLLISILQFAMSLECTNIIDSLKRMAWSVKTRDKCTSPQRRYFEHVGFLNIPNMVYDLNFWSRRKYNEIFGSMLVKPKSSSFISITSLVPHDEMPHVTKDKLVKLCVDKIIKTGWLKGIDEKAVPAIFDELMENDLGYILCQHLFYNWNLHTDGFCEFRGEDCGVITDIYNVFLRVVAAESLGSLVSVLRATRRGGIVYTNAVGCAGPLITEESIKKALLDVVKRVDSWNLTLVLDDLKKQCPSSESISRHPDLLLGFEMVAKQFESRIKNTAYMLYESLLNAPRGTRKLCLEVQVVHYLLPALVAHFLELSRTSDQSLLPKYATFLHHLTSSYDLSKCQYINRHTSITFEDVLLADCTAEESNAMLRLKSEAISKELERTGLPQNVFEVIDDVFLGFTFLKLDSDDQIWRPNFKAWSAQVYRFFAKVLHSIKTTAKRYGGVHEQPFSFNWETSPLKQFLRLLEAVARRAKENNFKSYWQQVKRRISQPQQGVSHEQLGALLMYLGLKQVSKDKKSKVERKFASNACAFDPLAMAYAAFLDEDWSKLKQALASWLNPHGALQDPSLVSLSFARDNPEVYGTLLETLGRNMKVFMKKPGTITFFPIAHCRWCGLVDCPEFRVCQECREMNGEYLDVNLFCSERCETSAMNDVHCKEHELFLIEKLQESFMF